MANKRFRINLPVPDDLVLVRMQRPNDISALCQMLANFVASQVSHRINQAVASNPGLNYVSFVAPPPEQQKGYVDPNASIINYELNKQRTARAFSINLLQAKPVQFTLRYLWGVPIAHSLYGDTVSVSLEQAYQEMRNVLQAESGADFRDAFWKTIFEGSGKDADGDPSILRDVEFIPVRNLLDFDANLFKMAFRTKWYSNDEVQSFWKFAMESERELQSFYKQFPINRASNHFGGSSGPARSLPTQPSDDPASEAHIFEMVTTAPNVQFDELHFLSPPPYPSRTAALFPSPQNILMDHAFRKVDILRSIPLHGPFSNEMGLLLQTRLEKYDLTFAEVTITIQLNTDVRATHVTRNQK
eukprot:ANDGO_00838.mRNA.1 hypothetical protein